MPGNKISNAPENDSFTVFYAFGIKEESKEDYWRVVECKTGIRLQDS